MDFKLFENIIKISKELYVDQEIWDKFEILNI